MARDKKRKNLGRGLSALLGEETASVVEEKAIEDVSNDAISTESGTGPQKTVALSLLDPGKYQPRQNFDEQAIEGLSQSIKEKGILQPILVRPHPDGSARFEIIAGERRWQAAQKAQLHDVPIIIREMDDQEAAEIALVENLQRQDLSPLEEAEGYNRLMQEFNHTQEALSKALGKSRSHVANMMRLLGLPLEVKTFVDEGLLSAGHARALLNCDTPLDVAKQVIKKGLNVRQTEQLAKSSGVVARPKVKKEKDADTLALQNDLANKLGLKVELTPNGPKGVLTLHYQTLEQLDDLVSKLGKSNPAQVEETLDPVSLVEVRQEFKSL